MYARYFTVYTGWRARGTTHQDQSSTLDLRSPMTINLLTAITDVDETNGGTLAIPAVNAKFLLKALREGLNRLLSYPPRSILDARAGTVVITDGRLLHGTALIIPMNPELCHAQRSVYAETGMRKEKRGKGGGGALDAQHG